MGNEYSKSWKLHSFLMWWTLALDNVNNKFVASASAWKFICELWPNAFKNRCWFVSCISNFGKLNSFETKLNSFDSVWNYNQLYGFWVNDPLVFHTFLLLSFINLIMIYKTKHIVNIIKQHLVSLNTQG